MYVAEFSAAIQRDNMYLLSGKIFTKYYHKKRRLKNSVDNVTFLSEEKKCVSLYVEKKKVHKSMHLA